MNPDVTAPIIHHNGDRKATLVARLEAAYDAIGAAYEVLRQCAPNGRNYYPEPGRMARAVAQHRERQAHLDAVRFSLEAEIIQIEKDTRSTPEG